MAEKIPAPIGGELNLSGVSRLGPGLGAESQTTSKTLDTEGSAYSVNNEVIPLSPTLAWIVLYVKLLCNFEILFKYEDDKLGMNVSFEHR